MKKCKAQRTKTEIRKSIIRNDIRAKKDLIKLL